ncbi:MAG: metalloregulator ArsR/SmtB family transcription factor [Candidatus Obscuribacterales bacterium]|nr:metalloregulator ArsR/SmtB family transcription factor [Candidatus Obscuribacterales bacterium]
METKKAVEALSALAQESRLDIFRLLVRKGPQGSSSPGELSEQLDIPPATMSFHLKELTRAGLLTSRREGRSKIYSADFSGMRSLIDFLLENCCSENGGKC